MRFPFIFKRIFFAALAGIALVINIHAQKGYPYVSPFVLNESIDNDNFDLVQDNNQNILIANRKGILTFDSRNWDLLPLPYFPVVLAKSPTDGIIYTGCRNGFGRLDQDVTGKYNYTLLSDTIFTGKISAIEILSNQEFFISRNRIYYSSSSSDQDISYWEFPYEHFVSGSFVFQDEFYFMVYNMGLFKAEADTFKIVLSDHFSTHTKLLFNLETDTTEVLVGTSNNELFIFKGSGFSPVFIKDSEYLKASIITDGAFLGDNKIAVGSLMGGVLICDYKTGVTSAIINYKTGIPDDEIYCLGTDSNYGLWLCHPFGVSRIDNHLNIANLTWYPGLSGNLTNTAFFSNQLYIGTSDGLYVLQEKRENREKLVYDKLVEKPVIETQPVEKKIIQSNTSEKVTKSPEINKPPPVETLSKKELRKKRRESKSQINTVEPVTAPTQQKGILDRIFKSGENPGSTRERIAENPDYIINKKKVYSLQSISHSYVKISGISGKCTEIIAIKNHLLVSTYNGLYDIYNKQVYSVLPNTNINFLNPGPDDNILFAGSGKSLFILLLKENRWEVVREFDALNYQVYSACMTSPTELWLGSDNSAHKLTLDEYYYADIDEIFPITTKFSDKVILRTINKQLYLFLSSGIFRLENNEINTVKTFDNLSSLPGYYFSDNNMVYYRSSGRWAYIADSAAGINFPEEYLNIFQSVQDLYLNKAGDLYIIANNQEIFQILKDAGEIKSEGFSVFFSGLKGTDDQLFPLVKPKISYKKSSLRIEFAAPYYLAPGKTEFSYMIKGLNNEWSPWSSISTIEYPLLPPGEYTIQAKARNIFGVESEVSSLDIIIRPPFWRTTIFYILMIILTFTLFGFIVKIREQNLKNAKLILEQKVTERTAEIERQKNEISEQKKEITDSIYYAKRIQIAVLPPTKLLSAVLPEHFVLFLPKDIVSGDFYWSSVKGDKIVLLAADCTGHGVPGAFMSMLGISFLNEIVSTHKLDNAGTILNELREHVKATLAKSGDEVQARDGMDIALCIIDQKQMKLQFAGAYNPLFMVRESELTEIKADKMPIGWYDINTGFTNNVINLRKSDCFYIFSDGFIDQFGGTKEKKFLSKQFKNLLVRIHLQPMTKQKEMLTMAFENWKGTLQQIDDVLVIGFRI